VLDLGLDSSFVGALSVSAERCGMGIKLGLRVDEAFGWIFSGSWGGSMLRRQSQVMITGGFMIGARK